MHVDPGLFAYCTDREREILNAIIKAEGNGRVAAKALGVCATYPTDRLRDVKAKAAKRGYAPGHFESGAAPGFSIGKVTVQRAGDGTVERTWERQLPDQERLLEALRDAIGAMKDEIAPLPPVTAPEALMSDLCNLYTFTDFHLGMLAWHREGGADWDLAIAEKTLIAYAARSAIHPPLLICWNFTRPAFAGVKILMTLARN